MNEIPRATIHGAGIVETVLAYVAGALEAAAEAELEEPEEPEEPAPAPEAPKPRRRGLLLGENLDVLERVLNRDILTDRKVAHLRLCPWGGIDAWIRFYACGHETKVHVEEVALVHAQFNTDMAQLIVKTIKDAPCPSCEAALANPVLGKLGET